MNYVNIQVRCSLFDEADDSITSVVNGKGDGRMFPHSYGIILQ